MNGIIPKPVSDPGKKVGWGKIVLAVLLLLISVNLALLNYRNFFVSEPSKPRPVESKLSDPLGIKPITQPYPEPTPTRGLPGPVVSQVTTCPQACLDAIAQIDRLDDAFGLDTIEMGATIAVAMEGGGAEFGNAEAAINLVKEVGQGTPLGRILGSGAAVTGKAYGIERVPVVKGQAMPAYDPRAVQGQGVTYATTTMGADHTAGYAVTANILGVGGTVDPLKPEGGLRTFIKEPRHGENRDTAFPQKCSG